MLKRKLICLIALISAVSIIGIIGCAHDRSNRILEPDTFPTDAEVFRDEFGSTVTFQAFLGSKLDAVQIDQVTTYSGSQALQVIVPDSGDPSGSYAGGAFTCGIARDLTGYNALTFYARASRNATLDVAGIGNDNTGTSKYTAEVSNLELTTAWQKYVVPIPLSAKLTAEEGLFYFAEGPEGGIGCQLWFDEIIFESLGTIYDPQPAIPYDTVEVEETDTITVSGTTVTFDVDGSLQTVSAMPGYFTFASSDETVVKVDSTGVLIAVGVGNAEVTATLGSVAASGAVTVQVGAPSAVPTTPAPTPTVPEGDVISLFSNVYTNVTVDTWCADWAESFAELFDETISGDDVKRYELPNTFAGVLFESETIDVSGMTYFHMDIWTPNSTELPKRFKIKLIDFGANGEYGGGDDMEHEVSIDKNNYSLFASETWVSIDIPMILFDGLLTKSHLAQMIISGDLSTVYVDNIYFYTDGLPSAPAIPAPTPDEDPSSVISLFSDVYTDEPVDSWSLAYDRADVVDYMIDSDNTKKYTGHDDNWFAAIDFKSNAIDASSMTHFHMNFWTPDPTTSPAEFTIKLYDLGPDGTYGTGDDILGEVTLDEADLSTGWWVSLDIPFDAFSGLTSRSHLAQIYISGHPDTVYLDNIYFYDSGIPLAPPEPAPTPTLPESDVISIYSDAYTDQPVDFWMNSDWGDIDADTSTVTISGNDVKKLVIGTYTGIQFSDPTINAGAMTHFHMDIWTPDETVAPSAFRIKLVDWGADGTYGGTDDVEDEMSYSESTMISGNWISLDIPLDDFEDMTTREHLAQLILSATHETDFTVFVDNVYFHK